MQRMAVVAQLVERWLVVPDVAGSSPVDRPNTSGTSGSVSPVLERDPHAELGAPWVLIVWDDPVNLMNYVVYVFRTHFGFAREEAERLMLLVHHEGRAAVTTGPREEIERHAQAMHDYGLQATITKATP
jgi:ATP-dependent Clp protease adaptor protein ClpS